MKMPKIINILIQKIKNKMKILHEKKPYIEPIILSVLTSMIGFFSSMCVTDITTGKKPVKFYSSSYFWVTIFILVIVIMYYILLSTYSFKYINTKNKIEEGKEELISVYIDTTKEDIKQRDVNSFNQATYIFENFVDQLNKVK